MPSASVKNRTMTSAPSTAPGATVTGQRQSKNIVAITSSATTENGMMASM